MIHRSTLVSFFAVSGAISAASAGQHGIRSLRGKAGADEDRELQYVWAPPPATWGPGTGAPDPVESWLAPPTSLPPKAAPVGSVGSAPAPTWTPPTGSPTKAPTPGSAPPAPAPAPAPRPPPEAPAPAPRPPPVGTGGSASGGSAGAGKSSKSAKSSRSAAATGGSETAFSGGSGKSSKTAKSARSAAATGGSETAFSGGSGKSSKTAKSARSAALLEGPRPHSPVAPASPPKRPSPQGLLRYWRVRDRILRWLRQVLQNGQVPRSAAATGGSETASPVAPASPPNGQVGKVCCGYWRVRDRILRWLRQVLQNGQVLEERQNGQERQGRQWLHRCRIRRFRIRRCRWTRLPARRRPCPRSPPFPLKGGVGVERGRTGRARDEGTRSADIQIKGFGGSAPRKAPILLSRLPRAPDREGPSWKGLLRGALSVPI